METTHSPEGKQKAARAYKESYDKYKKMSEDVLDSEPIPLGHRQAIRKYFELIRPSRTAMPQPPPGSRMPRLPPPKASNLPKVRGKSWSLPPSLPDPPG